MDVNEVNELLEYQVAYNMAIAEDSLKNDYGANMGNVLLGAYQSGIKITAKIATAVESELLGLNIY